MKILVVGGAGYIGSHMTLCLGERDHEVIVIDDLSSGYEDAVLCGKLVRGNVGDNDLLQRVLEEYRPDAVMHFASYIQVGESVSAPGKYYHNNVVNTLSMLETMMRAGTRRLVFSSSAAIFAASDTLIGEDFPKNPGSPYGRTKLIIEQVLEDYDRAYGLKYCSLRYFNAAGADPKGRLGERHEPESHLIPIVLQAASGRRDYIQVNGRDYSTPDGTCVRDYVHVADLCSAHLLAVSRLCGGGSSASFNLGNGEGFSVDEVIRAAEDVTGRRIPVRYGPRRAGDCPRLVADSTKARNELGWEPRYGSLRDIVRHAWNWEKQSLGK